MDVANSVNFTFELTFLTRKSYIELFLVTGTLAWATVWFVFGEGWNFWRGPWFRLVLIAVIAWGSSIAFQAMTSLPQMLAPLIIGILVRNIGYLDMREFAEIDAFLRYEKTIYAHLSDGDAVLLLNNPFIY